MIKNIYNINKLIIVILLNNISSKEFLDSIFHNFIIFLIKENFCLDRSSNFNYSLVMMNKNDNKEVDPSNISGPVQNNINESKRIERIDNWFNKGWLDDKRKEELINSGKDLDEKELNTWLMEQDKREYLLNQAEEQEKIKKIYEWLNNVEESSSSSQTTDNKPNSKPSSQWSPSSSEQGDPSISNINSNMDQIKDYIDFSELFNDINYLIIPEYFIIYTCFFIIFMCFLMIYCIIIKKFF